MKVVIIGAGVAGLSIGWRLVQSGTEVLLLERAQAAQGATWAAAGMIAPTAETEHGPQSESEFARWSASLWPKFAQEVEAGSGRRIGYIRDGSLIVATTEDEARELAARGNRKLLSPQEVKHREPLLSGKVAGAIWESDEAQVDSRALGIALADAFVRAGGKLSTNETGISIETGHEYLGVRTQFALHGADRVLVAAGAWTSRIEMDDPALPPIRPVKGEVLALIPPPGVMLPAQVVWGNGVYLVPRDGRLLIGATSEEIGFDTTVTDRAENWLTDRAIGLMPLLASWEIDEHWAGLRPAAPDGLPVLGETRIKNLFVATGQYRNGILFAPAVAETMCRLVLGEEVPEIRAFSPQRFANVP